HRAGAAGGDGHSGSIHQRWWTGDPDHHRHQPVLEQPAVLRCAAGRVAGAARGLARPCRRTRCPNPRTVMKRRTRLLGAWAALLLTAPLAACGLQPASGYAPPVEPVSIQPIEGAEDYPITVGSKNFTEQLILGKIAVLVLRAAGFPVT